VTGKIGGRKPEVILVARRSSLVARQKSEVVWSLVRSRAGDRCRTAGSGASSIGRVTTPPTTRRRRGWRRCWERSGMAGTPPAPRSHRSTVVGANSFAQCTTCVTLSTAIGQDSRKSEVGSHFGRSSLDAGHQSVEASRKPEATTDHCRDWRLEAGGWRLGTRGPRPETDGGLDRSVEAPKPVVSRVGAPSSAA
jgi:hypothetical protein